jgi:ABC-type polysaccharide/polyol phosphate export permease
MASPTRTWMSVLLGLVVVFFLFYNVSQIVDIVWAWNAPISQKMTSIPALLDTDRRLGMSGEGVLLVLYIIAGLCIFLNRHEKPHWTSSQLTCFILFGVFLGLAFVASSMSFVEGMTQGKRPNHVLIGEACLAAFRLLLLGGLIGCAVHVLKSHP